MPIGALLGSERALGGFDDVPTGSTWAWLPAACAAALATLDVYRAPSRCSRTCASSRRVASERLGELRERFDRIGDVRAVGCFQAIEFVRDRETAELDPELQDAVADRDAAPRRDRRLLDHLAQHPAVAGDAGRASLDRAYAIVAESIEAALAASDAMSALEAELARRARRDAGGRDAEADPGARPRRRGRWCEIEGRGEVLCLCSNDYLGLANHPEVVAAGGRGARRATAPAPPRCASSAASSSPRSSSSATSPSFLRHRGRAHLRLLLERERGAARRPLRRAHRGLLRRAQPRLDHRRHAPRAPRPQGGLRARRRRRPAPRARRGARARAPADRHRRRLQHGGRPGADRRAGRDRAPSTTRR